MTDWLAALEDPASFGADRPVERVETHISRVYLVGEDVWKLKKAVDFGFLDHTDLAARKAACEAEVTLNRRLAPDVYLGVEAVVAAPGGVAVRPPRPDDEVLEWAVHMRRMPDADRADVLLAEGRLGFDAVEAIAVRLARFHAACRVDEQTTAYGLPEAILRNVAENVAQTEGALGELLSDAERRAIVAAQTGFCEAHDALLRRRAERGCARDGHGDLRLEHVYLRDGQVVVLDCIEFADRFRYADVAADIAFLAMDFTQAGRADLAEHLLAVYARESNDFELYAVVDFYEAYRAWVRGKIACFVAAEEGIPDPERARALAAARHYFLVALGASRPRALSPRIVVVCGPVAAGKSTVAASLSRRLAAPIVDADRTRKSMIGVAPTTHVAEGSWQGAYDPRFTEEVYAELLRRAAYVLASGRSVVLDASFRARHLRAAVGELANKAGVPWGIVECAAPREVLAARLRAREQAPAGVSDARSALLDSFLAAWEPVEPAEASSYLRLPTDGSLDGIEAALRPWVPGWPAGLQG